MISLQTILSLLPESRKDSARNWAVYTLQWLPLALSAGNAKATTSTQDSSDFIATHLKAYVTDVATPPVENTTPQATLTLQIGDSSFMPDGNALHLQTLAISAGDRRGHALDFPIYIQRNTSLVGFLTNLTPTAMNVRLHVFGLRIFDRGRATSSL